MAVIGRFGPPLALMVVIFALSSRQDLDPGDGALGDVVPVVAHLGEYALLFLLWRRALGVSLAAAVIAVLYAITDELHQSFVPGRDSTVLDVAVDTVGVAAAWAATAARASRARWP